MKRKLEKPEVKIVKLQSMDIIATSGGKVDVPEHTINMSSSKGHVMNNWSLQ